MAFLLLVAFFEVFMEMALYLILALHPRSHCVADLIEFKDRFA